MAGQNKDKYKRQSTIFKKISQDRNLSKNVSNGFVILKQKIDDYFFIKRIEVTKRSIYDSKEHQEVIYKYPKFETLIAKFKNLVQLEKVKNYIRSKLDSLLSMTKRENNVTIDKEKKKVFKEKINKFKKENKVKEAL